MWHGNNWDDNSFKIFSGHEAEEKKKKRIVICPFRKFIWIEWFTLNNVCWCFQAVINSCHQRKYYKCGKNLLYKEELSTSRFYQLKIWNIPSALKEYMHKNDLKIFYIYVWLGGCIDWNVRKRKNNLIKI